MIWYIYCFTAYSLSRGFDGVNAMDTKHLSFVQLDTEKNYDTRERLPVTSVHRADKVPSCHMLCFMNLDEVIPTQFFPQPISLGRYFGLTVMETRRIDPGMLAMLTCKTDKDPRKQF